MLLPKTMCNVSAIPYLAPPWPAGTSHCGVYMEVVSMHYSTGNDIREDLVGGRM